jgi:acetylornithine deacetylase/succinyl-diaminopimelate desuccinylase-like protein
MKGEKMNIEQVFHLIDPESIARDTLAFIEVRSETGNEGAGSLFFADMLRREGFDVEVDVVEPNRPNVYALVKGNGPERRPNPPTLMFNGHTDTIPVGNAALPFRDGDWIIGRGAEDMKGGLVAVVHAASALKRAGIQLAGDMWLTGVIGHETPVGKKEGPDRLIHHLRSGKMHADAMIIAEGPAAIWSASLGATVFTIAIASDRGSIHTIKVPFAENPACWLGRLLAEFEKLESRFDASPHHPLCGREQLNVGMIRAGDYFNRLPTPVTVTGSRRWTPGKTHADVEAEFQKICDILAAQSGLKFSVSLEGYREPFETPVDHPIIRALETAGRMVTGDSPDIIGMALVGDANLYACEGLLAPAYFGPGYETAHSDAERVSVSRLVQCAKVYAAAAMVFFGDSD